MALIPLLSRYIVTWQGSRHGHMSHPVAESLTCP